MLKGCYRNDINCVHRKENVSGLPETLAFLHGSLLGSKGEVRETATESASVVLWHRK